MGVAIDTLLVCTASGMVLLLSGVDFTDTSIDAVGLIQGAFSSQFGGLANWFIAIMLLIFAFTTLITATYIGHVNFKFACKNKTAFYVFFAIQMVIIAASGYLSLGVAFDLLDFALGLFCFFNIVAMMLLYKKIKGCFDDYDAQLKKGATDPLYDWDAFRKAEGLKPFDEE